MPSATVKEAVQKRITPSDHSSIIPGIDVNELKHSLDVLKYALDYSEAIVDTVRVPLIVLDKKLRVLTANRSFYDTFKISAKQTENQQIYKLNAGAWNIHKLRILLEKILPANTHLDNYEVEIAFPHIGHKTMLLNARRTYRQVNNTEAILLVIEDITDRKLLERQKDDFIGVVSHELRTPLTGIIAFSQILEKHLERSKDKKGSVLLSKMTEQMERLSGLTASFLNVYKIQNGKLTLVKRNFSIGDLITAIVRDFQYSTKAHRIKYPSQTKISLYADRERIAQVLVNLISNAIKYSPQKEKVVVSLVSDDKNVTVSVQDFGLGIPKEEQGKIFERFFRVKGKREKGIAGLGLGLYISHEIIKQHHGKLWLESEEGKGSTFYFSLPLKRTRSLKFKAKERSTTVLQSIA